MTIVTPQIDVCSEFSDLYDMCDSVPITDSESKSLVFVAGYVGFMMVTNKVECSLCKSELLTDNNLQVDLVEEQTTYLADIDRGGLKWPSDLLVEAVTQMFLIFKCIISEQFEAKFLSLGNHRSVLFELFTMRLNVCGLLEGKCICGVSLSQLLALTMSAVANIFLNNYSKRAADKQVKTTDKGKRKLSTLTKKF